MCDISFIVPVYNSEKYIRKAVESLLNINEFSYEILLIDDCSTDNSLNIIKNYESHYNNIFVIHLEESHGGSSFARNVGLEMSRGNYIMFLDNDDYYDSSLIYPLLLEIENKNAELLIYSSANVYENDCKRTKAEVGCKDNNDFDTGQQAFSFMYENGYYSGCVWLRIFKRNIILDNNIRFKNEIFIFEDDLFSFEYMMVCNKTLCRDTILYYYLIRNDSTSSIIKNDERYFIDFAYVYHNFLNIAYKHNLDKSSYFDNIKRYIKYFANRTIKKYCYATNRNYFNNQVLQMFILDLNDKNYGLVLRYLIKYPLFLKFYYKLKKCFARN